MKTDKELSVELMGDYLRAIYSNGHTVPMNEDDFKRLIKICYDAVKSLPDN